MANDHGPQNQSLGFSFYHITIRLEDMGAGLGPVWPGAAPPHLPIGASRRLRLPNDVLDGPVFSLLTHTQLYIHTYIYKGVHPPPPMSIPFRPHLHGDDVAAHPLRMRLSIPSSLIMLLVSSTKYDQNTAKFLQSRN
ncbi:hypothetical protein Hanom_Chr07g00584631 [Helianthus anomalus]